MFIHKTASPENFLVKLQSLAIKANPTPIDQKVAPIDNTVQNDHDKFDRKTHKNYKRRTSAQMQRARHIFAR